MRAFRANSKLAGAPGIAKGQKGHGRVDGLRIQTDRRDVALFGARGRVLAPA
ncbi:hypothetical protein [Primorskyibacter sedentarius]|uniref:hypothetical protein n=1 Tax=Primorskyibacter sedentarius TaxID=745311 RepID=UPI001404EAAF|nr:hypothetical protein [Primorskyibacter sedentarius]